MKPTFSLRLAVASLMLIAGGQASAALVLTVTEYIPDALTITISGTISTTTIGDLPGYLAIKNDWVNNNGFHTELFSAQPTVNVINASFGGSSFSVSAYDNGATYADSIELSTGGVAIQAGTEIFVTLQLTGTGIFNPANLYNLNLVSGFSNSTQDWARLETTAVPEPTAALLSGLGIAALATRRRR